MHLHLPAIYTDAHTYSDSNCDAYSNSDSDSNSYTYFDTETFTDGETGVNAETASHAATAPVAVYETETHCSTPTSRRERAKNFGVHVLSFARITSSGCLFSRSLFDGEWSAAGFLPY